MYYDLSIPWPLKPPPALAPSSKKGKGKLVDSGALVLSAEAQHTLDKILDMATHLGYGIVAFDLLLPQNTFDPVTLAAYNPAVQVEAHFESRDPRYKISRSDDQLLLLSRLTVTYNEACITGQGNGKCFVSANTNLLADFDLLAVLPLDAAAFTHACLNLSAPTPNGIDIITLDLATSPRLPFHLKRSVLMQAIANGCVFEVVYGIAMRVDSSSVPKDARRNVMAGARELIRQTDGKGIILSGNVAQCMEMRAPLDLQNLGGLLGFRPDQARAALSDNCRAVVMRAHSNRQAHRGAVSRPALLTPKDPRRKRKRSRSGSEENGEQREDEENMAF